MILATRANPPPIPADASKDRSSPGKVTGRLKRALDAMVWEGLTRSQASIEANLTEHALYSALRKPHVKAYFRAELEVLRENERARNIHALVSVRDGSNQMARVAAVKALEQLSEETQGRSATSPGVPGMTIRIMQVVAAPGQQPQVMQAAQIDAKNNHVTETE